MKRLFLITLGWAFAAVLAFSASSSITVTDQATGMEVGTESHTGSIHAQWTHEKYYNLDWGGSSTGDRQGVGYSALLDCKSRNKIVVRGEGSASNTTITFRLWFYDYNATQVGMPTESTAMVNTGTAEGTSNEALNAGYFHFVAETMDTLPGAEEFKIEIISVANGTGKLWARAL